MGLASHSRTTKDEGHAHNTFACIGLHNDDHDGAKRGDLTTTVAYRTALVLLRTYSMYVRQPALGQPARSR